MVRGVGVGVGVRVRVRVRVRSPPCSRRTSRSPRSDCASSPGRVIVGLGLGLGSGLGSGSGLVSGLELRHLSLGEADLIELILLELGSGSGFRVWV